MTTTPLAPAISVTIPLYNAEKYIGACLESLLAQTFQDFEVIVVDDCSTDNSCAVVENYIPKFGGRLKLFHLEKNSGGPGTPSNIGVNLSRGKYVYVMDNDDLVVNNSLKILYNYAEQADADIVNMARGYVFSSDSEKPFPSNENVKIVNWSLNPTAFSEKPIFEPDNIGARIQKFCAGMFGRTAWQKFIRRDLIIANNIFFPEKLRFAMDTVWAIQAFCCARKILTIPDALHIYRIIPTSASHTKRTPEENIPAAMKAMIVVFDAMNKFFDNKIFFQENPQYRWSLLNYLERACFYDLTGQNPEIPLADKFYTFLKNEFVKNFGYYGEIMAYLCTSSQFSRLRLEITSRRAFELENKLKQLQGG